MSRIFITGSTQGLGFATAQRLMSEGHEVVGHARSGQRAQSLRTALPGLADVLVGDLRSLDDVGDLAAAANASGPFDAVIHNAAMAPDQAEREMTEDGMPAMLQVNAAAPFVLTSLMDKPTRLIYMGAELATKTKPKLDDLLWESRRWNGMKAYAESKLYLLLLATELHEWHPEIAVNSVHPGWARTRLGGPKAPLAPEEAIDTQVWLATHDDLDVHESGHLLHGRKKLNRGPFADDLDVRRELQVHLAELTGVRMR